MTAVFGTGDSMGKKATKRKFNYEPNVPRCRICAHFQLEKTTMRDSIPALVSPAHCKLHNFAVDVYGVCDAWVGERDGAMLEVPNA